MVSTTCPSLPMRMKAFGAKLSGAASVLPKGRLRLNISPPPAAAAVAKKPRRDRLVAEERGSVRSGVMSASLCLRLRGELDGFANADVGAATADVPAHGLIDVGVCRTRVACQQRRGRHDLSGLAIAALHDFVLEPGLLNLCAGVRLADRFDRRNLRTADAVDRGDAGPCGDAVDVHGAGATQRGAATELGAGHAEHVSKNPKQWRVAIDIGAVCGSVDFDVEGHAEISI